jgi:hypothetical protein
MNRNPHPLRDAQIQPADPVVVSPYSERGHRVDERALPTAATTRGDSRWSWGRRPVDAPSNSGAPQIFSPSDLEPGRTRESSSYGSFDEFVARLRR